ncbi:hypothetical protein OG783_16150 [Streptomyces jietaisiensis]|uniref:anti-sigma factor family protein n=1 Tax=Streptomyces griseoaurantiacus TaxID=68213 RepID=UPI00324E1B49
MTSTTDKAGHPDVDELSDLSEDLLPPSRTEEVQGHLEGCASCAEIYASLTEIRDLLGALSGPTRMPEDVAARIDAALLDVSRETDSVADVSRETSAIESPAMSPSTTAPAPAPSVASARPAGHGRAATGPGRTGRPSRRRRTVLLGGVVTAAALGLGALLTQTLDNGGENDAASATAPHTDAAHTYSEGTLPDQVTTLLGSDRGGAESGSAKPWNTDPGEDSSAKSSGTAMQPNKTLRGTTVDIPPCIERAIDGHQAVLAADKGVYKDARVYLVVTPDASDSSRVAAYLVDASCTARSDASGTGTVLLRQTYARS